MLQRKGSKLVMPGMRYSLPSEIESAAVSQLTLNDFPTTAQSAHNPPFYTNIEVQVVAMRFLDWIVMDSSNIEKRWWL
jgi:hypothetical protein